MSIWKFSLAFRDQSDRRSFLQHSEKRKKNIRNSIYEFWLRKIIPVELFLLYRSLIVCNSTSLWNYPFSWSNIFKSIKLLDFTSNCPFLHLINILKLKNSSLSSWIQKRRSHLILKAKTPSTPEISFKPRETTPLYDIRNDSLKRLF